MIVWHDELIPKDPAVGTLSNSMKISFKSVTELKGSSEKEYRLDALIKYGGIFADTDVLVIRDLKKLRRRSFVTACVMPDPLCNTIILAAPSATALWKWKRDMLLCKTCPRKNIDLFARDILHWKKFERVPVDALLPQSSKGSALAQSQIYLSSGSARNGRACEKGRPKDGRFGSMLVSTGFAKRIRFGLAVSTYTLHAARAKSSCQVSSI